MYNIEYDYAKELKFRIEVAYKRVRTLKDLEKEKRKIEYDKKVKYIALEIETLLHLKNNTPHKLEN